MRSFLQHVDAVDRRIRRRKRLLFCFDFDGTLSPIVAHPRDAKLPPAWRKRLRALAAHPRITVAVVTGRVLSDIRRRVRLPGLVYAASHGCDVWRDGRFFARRGAEHRVPMKAIGRAMDAAFARERGVVVESKETSVAVHYRLVPRARKAAVKRRALQILQPSLDRHDWSLLHGKQLVEVRPRRSWDKGDAVRFIHKRFAPTALPLYFGDDTTDEDAFRALGRSGVTVRVGRKRGSAAQYVVPSLDAIAPWLDALLEAF